MNRRASWRPSLMVVVMVSTLVLVGCGGGSDEGSGRAGPEDNNIPAEEPSFAAGDPPAPSPSLRDLAGLAELREIFNGDAGRPRLILLLSPT